MLFIGCRYLALLSGSYAMYLGGSSVRNSVMKAGQVCDPKFTEHSTSERVDSSIYSSWKNIEEMCSVITEVVNMLF